jgi:hypothetical protein
MINLKAVIAVTLGVAAAGASAQPLNPPSDFRAPGVQMAAVQGQAVWRRYKGPEGAFTIELPARPSYEIEDQTTRAGTPYTIHTYKVALNEAVSFSVSVQATPADKVVDTGLLKAILEADKEFFTGGKWTGTWMTYQGLTAAESAGANAGAGIVARTRFVIRGQQMFIVRYFAMDDEAPAADVDRFMNSLIIL